MTEEEIEILLGDEERWNQGSLILQRIREIYFERGWTDGTVTVIDRRQK